MIEYFFLNGFLGLCVGFMVVLFVGLFIEAKKENKQIMRDFLIFPFVFAICVGLASLPFYYKNKNLAKIEVQRFRKINP